MFDRHWNRNTIRNLVDSNCYLEFGEHANLKAVCINEEDIESQTRDWRELAFVVPTKWLKNYCRTKFNNHDLNYFLQEQYTSDESELIFADALKERKIVMVDFC